MSSNSSFTNDHEKVLYISADILRQAHEWRNTERDVRKSVTRIRNDADYARLLASDSAVTKRDRTSSSGLRSASGLAAHAGPQGCVATSVTHLPPSWHAAGRL